MEITELDNLKMRTLKEVADSNLLVSQIKAELLELESQKEQFFTKRDNEVLARIHKLLNHSRILLEETNTNYTQVHQFYETLKGFSEYLGRAQESFNKNVEDFTEKSFKWQETITQQESNISDLKKETQQDKESLEREKQFIAKKRKQLEIDIKHLESQQQAFETSYKSLQQLWEKLKKK